MTGVAKGSESEFALSEKELRERLAPQNPEWALAAAEFGLAEYLYRQGQSAASIRHYKEAQRLNPENWNYKRQAWALTDGDRDYGTNFNKEVQKLNGKTVLRAAPVEEEVGNPARQLQYLKLSEHWFGIAGCPSSRGSSECPNTRGHTTTSTKSMSRSGHNSQFQAAIPPSVL